MAKELVILTERYSYTAQSSLGRMSMVYDKTYVQDPPQPRKEFFGNTMEDTARPGNIKVMKETCLPGGLRCKVGLFENDHYGKTIIFYTEDDGYTIKFGPLTWTYCLAHGGQTHKDTEGCVLIARNIINKDTIQGSLKTELRKFVEDKMNEGYEVYAEFVNLTQLK